MVADWPRPMLVEIGSIRRTEASRFHLGLWKKVPRGIVDEALIIARLLTNFPLWVGCASMRLVEFGPFWPISAV